MKKNKTCVYYLKNISRIRRYLTPEATKLLVHAYVISRIDYANSLLFGIKNTYLRRLQTIQNHAARLIFLSSRRHSATPLLYKLHWLPVEQRICYKILLLTHKSLYGKAPPYLTELLEWYTPGRHLRSSDSFLLAQNKSINSFGDRSFMCAAPKLWNRLPLHIRSLCDTGKFILNFVFIVFLKFSYFYFTSIL